MFCKHCGSRLRDDASFCTACGQPASRPSAPAGPPRPMAPPPLRQTYDRPPVPWQQPGYYPPHPPAPPPPKKRSGLKTVLVLLAIVVVLIPVILIGQLIADALKGSDPSATTSGGSTTQATTAAVTPGGLRDNFTGILGNGEDTWTVMIYMVGSDLESEGGYASGDIEEILAADLGSRVNVVIQTGGCSDWRLAGISDGSVQRWLVRDGQLVELQNLGNTGMLTADALAGFIGYAATGYPANRYALVFWDHGGGSLYGFGYDELYAGDCLYLSDIDSALTTAGTQFDIVGFDACLMGTVETACMLEPHADYLIASEETEPAYGWHYTPWLNAMSQNTSIGSIDLGRQIVDSFIAQNTPDSTLSVVELREMPRVYQTLCDYMAEADSSIAGTQAFNTISTAVSNTKSFAEGTYDLIDIIDFTNQSDIEGEDDLAAAIGKAVKYRNNCTTRGVYGLSMYFPYRDLSVYSYSRQIFGTFGFGDEIYDFYDAFVNILAGGQTKSDGKSLKENLTGEDTQDTDFSLFEWYDESLVDDYAYDAIDYTELEIFWDETNEYYYLPLTDADWELITAVEMQVLLDDGEGYIDLGSDQYYETDDAGNLILNYGDDNTWIAIGGQIACYYAEAIIDTEQGSIYLGYVPAILNGTDQIEIILEWDGDDADGFIAGYRFADSNSAIGDEGTIGKGYLPFYTGDVVDLICDYYTYDGEYDDVYYFGETLTIGDTLPAVTYEDVGDSPVLQCYMIVDIYQNHVWTETVEFSVQE